MSSHVFFPYRNRSSGMAILADAQLHNPRVLHFKASDRGRGAILAEITFRGGPIGLCSVHLDHISSVPTVSRKVLKVSLRKALTLIHQELVSHTIRTRSTEELLAWPALRRYEKLIIGGDFNTIPFSRPIRLMDDRFNDVLWPSLEYFKGSYKKTTLPVAPRIDFIFVSREIPALEAAVRRDTPGDHYPIRARVVLEGKRTFSGILEERYRGFVAGK
jgi:endonuclease/exonuclease/phosphatase family metal-dependent hydrolase